jgi:hypothetical protein
MSTAVAKSSNMKRLIENRDPKHWHAGKFGQSIRQSIRWMR